MLSPRTLATEWKHTAWNRRQAELRRRLLRSKNQPLESDLPVLILAGTQHQTAPAAWGELIHASLPTSQFFEFAGAGHAVLFTVGRSNVCAETRILDFLDDSAQPLEGACVAKLKPLPFRTPAD